MTLVIALTNKADEFWVAADTRGATDTNGTIVALPGIFPKAKLMRVGSEWAVLAVSGLSELNGRQVLDVVEQTGKKLFESDGMTRLLGTLKQLWADDYNQPWDTAAEKKEHHEKQRLSILVARKPGAFEFVHREWKNGQELFDVMSANPSYPFAVGIVPGAVTGLFKENMPLSEWSGLLAESFSKTAAHAPATVGFPIDVFRWKLGIGITFARYNTADALRNRIGMEKPV